MPDASRVHRHADFEDTHQLQMPPDVPCPTGPLQGLGDTGIPVPSSWGRPRVHAMSFPDPEVIERERVIRKAKADAVERFALLEATRQAQALKRTSQEHYTIGFNKGKDRGYTHGWWGGLAFGMMLGAGVCFIAIKIGFAFGGQA